MSSDYWEKRKEHLYYNVVRILVSRLCVHSKSMLDVGSSGAPYLDWFPHIPLRASLDIETPYTGTDITPIQADFMLWEPEREFDIVLCLQVLEHLEDPFAAAQKLLRCAPITVVSVPYLWPAGTTAGHIQDPVDERKMESWFGREPNFQYICGEVVSWQRRLIQVYERNDDRWRNTSERARLIRERRARKIASHGAKPLA